MLRILMRLRWFSVIAIIGSVLGAQLMAIVGAVYTLKAFGGYFGLTQSQILAGERFIGVDAMVQLVSALDSFLFSLVLFYFAMGVYLLFIRPASSDREGDQPVQRLSRWLNITSLGQLKKSLLEVIIVLLAVLFLNDALYLQDEVQVHWSILVKPVAVIAFAVALKLGDYEEH